MSPAARVAAACAVFAVVLGGTVPAGADGASHRLDQAKRRAAQLDASARQQAAVVHGARVQLARLDDEANAALDAVQAADTAVSRAAAAERAAQAVVAAAAVTTTEAHERLDALAANAYRTEAYGGSFAVTFSLVRSGDPSSFINGMNLLDQVGKKQSQTLDELRLAEAQQRRAEEAAAQATAIASAAADAARAAKSRADGLVTQQQHAVRVLDTLLASTRRAARAAHQRVGALERAIAAARARAAAIRRAQALAARSMPHAGCDGSSLAGYGNGQLPVSALCPLWGAPGEMLQPAAAAAFNRMSQAFAAAFGEPLCVTTSYRTYQHQVELYGSMPAGYAAVPGTSNHGWGLAVDLCGGIQVDDSPEHLWLMDHAAAFGWFHPSWALPGGPGPHEPWHWEYAE